MVDIDDQMLDAEIQKQRDKSHTMASIKESVNESVQDSEKQLSEQSIHEEELVNELGEYIIFAGMNP